MRRLLWAATLSMVVALGPVAGKAQEARSGGHVPDTVMGPRGLALGIESRFHNQVDDLVSPLRYSGVGFGPGLRWGFSGPSGIRDVTASYGSPRLTSSATARGSHFQEGHRFDTRLMVLQRVGSLGSGRVSFFLGGSIAGHFALYQHWYTREDKESWVHAFGLLQPGFGWSAELPRGGQLWQDVTFPLLGVAVRPGYEGLTEPPTAVWVGAGDVKGVDQAIHFLQPMGKRFRLGLTYAFAGLSYAEPQELAWNRQSLSLWVTVWNGGVG